MSKIKPLLVIVGLVASVIVGFVRVAHAQIATTSIRWFVQLDRALDGDRSGEVKLIGEEPEIVLTLQFANSKGPDIWGILALPDRARISVESENQIVPVQFTARFDPDVVDRMLPEGRSLRMKLRLQRHDGMPFSAGAYVITVDLSEFLASLELADGSAWRGADVKTRDMRRVVVKRFATATLDERVSKLSGDGNNYLYIGKYAEAIKALEECVRLAPGGWQAHGALGAAYLRSHRFQEAASSLERALPGFLKFNPRGQSIVSSHLATAYVRLGREADAARVLRSAGFPEGEIEQRLKQMR